MQANTIFGPAFLEFLKTYVDVHHSIYPTVPPQGIYFEALVEKTFRAIHRPLTLVRSGGVNQPRYDIQFEGHRISLKTETGLGTKPASINITKLCTTERDPWEAETLKARVIEHLSRYDTILMLRAVWAPRTLGISWSKSRSTYSDGLQIAAPHRSAGGRAARASAPMS